MKYVLLCYFAKSLPLKVPIDLSGIEIREEEKRSWGVREGISADRRTDFVSRRARHFLYTGRGRNINNHPICSRLIRIPSVFLPVVSASQCSEREQEFLVRRIAPLLFNWIRDITFLFLPPSPTLCFSFSSTILQLIKYPLRAPVFYLQHIYNKNLYCNVIFYFTLFYLIVRIKTRF